MQDDGSKFIWFDVRQQQSTQPHMGAARAASEMSQTRSGAARAAIGMSAWELHIELPMCTSICSVSLASKTKVCRLEPLLVLYLSPDLVGRPF